MMTVITETTLKPGQEQEWDQAFAERLHNARNQPGWVDLQVLSPEGQPHKRVVVGTWRSRADWERWHQTPIFQRTRGRMSAATAEDGQPHWYEVMERPALDA